MLGQVDAAHAALADLAEQLVLAEAEALVLAGQQLVGLPARDQMPAWISSSARRSWSSSAASPCSAVAFSRNAVSGPRRRGCCAATGRATCWRSPSSCAFVTRLEPANRRSRDRGRRVLPLELTPTSPKCDKRRCRLLHVLFSFSASLPTIYPQLGHQRAIDKSFRCNALAGSMIRCSAPIFYDTTAGRFD